MSIYGDVLAMFPELIQVYTMFSMRPKVGGGYEPRVPLFNINGVFIREGQSKMKIQGESRVTNEAGKFYCFEFIPQGQVEQGTYFEDSGEIMQIVDDATFAREGGFGAYGVQLVQGLTDKQVENKQVSKNVVADYGG